MGADANHETKATKYSETWFGIAGAAAPAVVFFGTIFIMSVVGIRGAKFYWIAGIFSVFAAFLLYKDKDKFQKAVIEGIKNDIFPIIMLSFFFAGILSKVLLAGNLVNGLLWVTSLIHLPASLLPLLTFLTCVVISTATGTATGTLTAVGTIMIPLGVQSGCSVGVMCGAVLSGSVFGDNVAPISDTTIASALTQETTIKKVVRSRFKYAIVAAIFAAIMLVVVGIQTTDSTALMELSVDAGSAKYLVFLVIPILVVILSLKGANLITALLIGNAIGVVLLLALNCLTFADLFLESGIFISGMEGMTGALLLLMYGFILSSIMQDTGLQNNVLARVKTYAKTPRSAEIVCLLFIVVVSIVIGAPTVNIAICGPVIHEILEEFRVDRARAANVLDGVCCGVGYLMPHNPPSMMLTGLVISTGATLDPNFNPLNYIGYSYHCMGLVVVFTVAILTGWGRKLQPDTAPDKR